MLENTCETPPLCLQYPHALTCIDWGQRCAPERDVAPQLSALGPAAKPEKTIARLAPIVSAIRAAWAQEASDRAAASGATLSDAEREFDAYFHVRRSARGDGATALCEAVVVAYHDLLLESLKGDDLLPLEVGQLRGAVERLLHRLGRGQSQAPQVAPPHAAPMPTTADVDPMLRWRRGHFMFFALIQALIVTHHWLVLSLRQHRMQSAREALELATDLWWASAAAFRFASDFSGEAYAEVIRPSMSPPFVREGFSGLLFADHSYLLRQLRQTRPLIERLPAPLHAQHRQYMWGLNAMYESHAYVCERFVGDEASLRGGDKKDALGAVSVIRGALRKRTLMSVGGPGLGQLQ